MSALLALLLVPQAQAYELSGRSWAYQDNPVEMPFSLNVNSFPSAYLRSEIEDGYIEGIAVWNSQGKAGFEIGYGGWTTDTVWGGGAPNGTQNALWTQNTPDGAVALSARIFLDADIVECDIEYFGANAEGSVIWAFDPTVAAESTEYHFIYTTVHELGHCLGLSHSADPTAVMRETQSKGLGPGDWDLRDDDVDGIQALYGVVEPDLSLSVDVEEAPVEQPGAAFSMTVTVENVGTGTAFDVMGSAVVTSGVEWVAITGSTAEMGDILAGSSQGSAETALVFPLKVPDDCLNPGTGEVEITVTDAAGGVYTAGASIPVVCPEPEREYVDDIEGTWTACATASAAAGWWALLPGALVLLRRRRSGRL